MDFHEKPIKGLSLARYGGLNMVKQKNNYGNDTYHSAPERYGFYAFIFPYIELFLIGSTKVKEYDEGTYKKFTPKGGEIWTHLRPPSASMIIQAKGSWFKVRVDDMPAICKKAFAKEVGYQYAQEIYNYGDLNNPDRKIQRYSPMNKAPYANLSKDHLEVFVCRDTIL